MILHWTSLGATGTILATVVPHLPHRGHGDRKTGECILLGEEGNTARFCSVQFFCELISFHNKGICS